MRRRPEQDICQTIEIDLPWVDVIVLDLVIGELRETLRIFDLHACNLEVLNMGTPADIVGGFCVGGIRDDRDRGLFLDRAGEISG
ncbi:MAG: hypothetical protein JWO36_2656 [Myxococcales bacterium]|nr:hypothetical protein [Myxococcales bacterium]